MFQVTQMKMFWLLQFSLIQKTEVESKANGLYVRFDDGMKTGSDSLKAKINNKIKAISKSREMPVQFLNFLLFVYLFNKLAIYYIS